MLKFNFDTILESVARWCIYLLIFLLPIWFLPVGSSSALFHKQMFAGFAALAGILALLLRMFSSGTISFPKHTSLLAVGVFVAVVGVATAFSQSPLYSFWGSGGEPFSFFSILVYGAVFLLSALVFEKQEIMVRAARFFFAGALVVGIYVLLQLNGIFLLPLAFTRTTAFNPIGLISEAGIFFGLVFLLGVGALSFFGSRLRRFEKYALLFLIFLAALILFIANARWVWASLAISFLLLLMIDAARRWGLHGEERKKVLPLGIVLVLAAAAVAFFTQIPSLIPTAIEVQPAVGETFSIAKKTIAESPVTGSGPATFLYQWRNLRSAEVNRGPFWNIDFWQGAPGVFTIVTEGGFLAVFGLILLMLVYAHAGLRLFLQKRFDAALVWLAGVYLLLFLFSSPLHIMFLLLFFLVFGALAGGHVSRIGFLASPQKAVIVSLAIVCFVVGAVIGGFWTVKRYAGVMYHAYGVRTAQENPDAALDALSKAVRWDRTQSLYARDLGQLLGEKAAALAGGGVSSDQQRAQDLFNQAVQSVRLATVLNPQEVNNWLGLGSIYEKMMPFSSDVGRFTIEAYTEAVKWAPQNPIVFEALGRIAFGESLRAGQQIARLEERVASAGEGEQLQNQASSLKAFKEAQQQSARANLDNAILLKSNYMPARLLRVQLLGEERGAESLETAIQEAEALLESSELDTSALFELGVMYWRATKLEEAGRALESVIGADPSNNYARYFLALVYRAREDDGAARAMLRQILQTEPENNNVKKMIENIGSDGHILEGTNINIYLTPLSV
ncbi:MAG: hypothetical protein A2939_01860 [Parcubacteria group bacterium RIFCSPLOWO2_01_FULL_48_18]|nr:MAG: hypothetical protein A3J67_04980 [Parcubacteria group bacterium RIFCSPHIGHO2_02_FULL_48_10b]OHB21821.1 MAG: hypothetical protein A2939_01860 [Parcubacteria group bacterium RIFCSPLOWO2_01_FULL_48_18]